MRTTNRTLWRAAFMGMLLAGALPAGAATKTWNATGTNDWWTGANWSGSAVPQAGDDVVITNAGAGVILSNAAPAYGWLASLVVSNASLIFTNWTTTLSATNVTIATNGLVTGAGPFTNAPDMSNRVYVICSNLTIDAGGRIDVSARGYAGGAASSAGSGPAGGAGSYWDPYGAGHGGYGGVIYGNGSTFGGGMYDSASAPTIPGSGGGGGTAGGPGTAGGGAVRIAASGKVTVNGSILADGGMSGNRVGTGSGGSIFITCSTVAGATGLIRADGGASTTDLPGSGGGGRIAVSNDTAAQALEPTPYVRFSANCGERTTAETSRGGIGSIYLTDARLLADGLTNIVHGRIESPLAFTNSFLTITNRWLGLAAGVQATVTGDVLISGAYSKLEIGGATMGWFGGTTYRFDQPGGSALKVGGKLVLTNATQMRVFSGITTNPVLVRGALVDVTGDFNITPGCTVHIYSHPTNGASPEFRMKNFTIATNAAVAATNGFAGAARGYGSSGSGSSWWGWGDGKGYAHGGAGYGGRGGYTNDSALSGLTYGDSNAPALPGSGGGGAATYTGLDNKAGDGGSLIRLIATERVTLKNGSQLLADGWSATGGISDRQNGGGSGGGVYIYCRQFLGETGGVISACGGNASYTGGGGGGGQVAVWRVIDDAPPRVTVRVNGGMGRSAGADAPAYSGTNGTVAWGWNPSPEPIMYNSTPTNVTSSGATLRGYLHAAGVPTGVVAVCWDDADGGDPTSGLWQVTNSWPAGAWATYDYPSTNVTLPTSDLIYYYRFWATNSIGASWPTNSEYFLGGNITITAAGPAAEYGLVPGTFTVHRAVTGTGMPITVYYAVSGTAGENVDYVLSPASGSVTIPAGTDTADVIVQPLADLDPAEGTETVTLTLTPGKYGLGTPFSNTLSITDMAVVPGLNTTVGAGNWNDGLCWSQWRRPTAGDDVVVQHNLQTDASSGWLSSLTVSNATLTVSNWSTTLSATNVTIATNGVITCAGPFTNGVMTNRVHVICTNLTIDAGGKIDVSAKGYAGGAVGASGHGPAAGTYMYWDPYGAGHGGYGGSQFGNGHTFGGAMHDSVSAPLVPGSGGGGNYSSSGSAGGGAVRIDASGKVTVNGSILADGGASSSRVGTGSGGSIFITCSTMAGATGLIRADGGILTDTGYAGSGGGGRIAVSNDAAAQALEPTPYVRFSANCGQRTTTETSRGGIGSIYLTDARLLADGLTNIVHGRIESPLAFTNSFLMITNRWLGLAAGVQATVTGDVLISGAYSKLEIGGVPMGSYGGFTYRFDQPGGSALRVGGNLVLTNTTQMRVFSGITTNPVLVRGARVDVAGEFCIGTGCTVYVYSHPTNGASPEFRMKNFTITTNAVMNAAAWGFTGAGYGSGSSGSVNNLWGWGDGKGYTRGGAGYGGAGYALDGQGGLTYGSSNAPALPGSGGGQGSSYLYSYAGNGGGLIRLIATERVTLKNGSQLLAYGGSGVSSTEAGRDVGAGSGGGVYIFTYRFLGETGAVINASGGNSTGYTCGGGGGGRVAIWRVYDDAPPQVTVNVNGGMGRSTGANAPVYSGAEGTIVWGLKSPPGTVFMVH